VGVAELDQLLLLHVNRFVGVSPSFDSFVRFLSFSSFIKMLPLIVPFVVLWVASSAADRQTVRVQILAVLVASIAALAIARGLAVLLPFHDRPIHMPELSLKLVKGFGSNFLRGWSSFPSDHATLSFALASGLALINRRMGVFALVHAAVVVCLPRLYLSLHFPSDLLVGAGLGAGASWLVLKQEHLFRCIRTCHQLGMRYHKTFYAALFVFVEQLAEMFDGVRSLIGYIF
jgi:undecaprenyl-diphosphatase